VASGQWGRQEKCITGAREKNTAIRGARVEKCIDIAVVLHKGAWIKTEISNLRGG
jgi:hypothetical protein